MTSKTAQRNRISAMEIFAKVLTITDVERRLSLSDGCVPALTRFEGCHGNGIVLPVKDDDGNSWDFRCIIRSGVVPKLVIDSGWIKFVKSKDLHKGDIVILYMEEDIITEANYKIEVKRTNTFNSVNREGNLGSK